VVHSLRIEAAQLEMLLAHAENSLPLEAVALLFGTEKTGQVFVNTVELLENYASSKTKFAVDPVKQYNLLVRAEERGEELVCIFHSHPAPPVPSESDLRNMRLNSVVWIIASKTTGKWKHGAYMLDGEQLSEIRIVMTDGAP
jgi:proteasome lid subunit RPN8/RPN11